MGDLGTSGTTRDHLWGNVIWVRVPVMLVPPASAVSPDGLDVLVMSMMAAYHQLDHTKTAVQQQLGVLG